MRLLVRAAVLIAAAILPLLAQDRPLPDLATLLQKTRDHLRDDWSLEDRFAYFERRTDYKPGDNGQPRVETVKLFEVRPGAGGRPYRRLIEVNGRKRSADELARDDREHQKRIAERERDVMTAAGRQRRAEREAKERREEEETWDDIVRVYNFRIVGREQVDGRSLVVLEFEPKPDSHPLSDNGDRMKKVRGRVWISEDDYQVARIDGKVLEDIAIGWGLIGKLYAGANGSYVRHKMDGEGWLPQQLTYAATGRALVKRFAVHTVIEYFDYRKAG